MKILARKKREEAPSGRNAPWMNTFADLMNLLLCFFVMLFAASEVDAEKFQEIAISMSNSIGIFDGGGKTFGEGPLISSGMSQLNNLDQYTTSMGKQAETEKEDEGENESQGKEETNLNEALEVMQGKMQEVSDDMFTTIEELTMEHNLADYVELSIDPEYRYIQLSMKGSILYD